MHLWHNSAVRKHRSVCVLHTLLHARVLIVTCDREVGMKAYIMGISGLAACWDALKLLQKANVQCKQHYMLLGWRCVPRAAALKD